MNHQKNEQIKLWAEEIRQSNRHAFDELFRCLYPRLVHYSVKYTRYKPASCDVVQEAFVALWQRRNQIDSGQSLKAYMYKVVRNRSINWLKQRENQNEPLDETMNFSLADRAASDQTGYLKKLFSKWIAELPERQKEAFELSRNEGLNHEEIAGIMELSPKTVNNHIVAALRTLRDRYDSYQNENDEV